MSTEKTYQLIDDYLSGRLFGRELDKFKAELKVNKKLQEQVALQQALIAEIEAKRKAELKAYLSENTSKKGGFSFMPSLASSLGAAALISMLVAAYFIIDFAVDRQTEQFVNDTKPKLPRRDTSTEEANYFFDSLANDTQTLAIATEPATSENEPELSENEEIPVPEISEEEEDYFDQAPEVNKEMADEVAIADADFEVKKDVLLSSRRYVIRPATYTEPTATASTEATSGKKPTVRKTKEDTVEKRADYAEVEIATPEPKKPTAKSLSVEYWQSVVNYKGYNFDGKRLKLYGVSESKPIEFKELDERVYLKMDSKQYYLEKNDSYNRLIELKNPTLLQILND